MNRLLPAASAAMTGIFVGATIGATRFVIDQTNPASRRRLKGGQEVRKSSSSHPAFSFTGCP